MKMPVTISGVREGRPDYSHYAVKKALQSGATAQKDVLSSILSETIPAGTEIERGFPGTALAPEGYHIVVNEIVIINSTNTLIRVRVYHRTDTGDELIASSYGYEDVVITFDPGYIMPRGDFPTPYHAIVIKLENMSDVNIEVSITLKGIAEPED